MQPINLKSFKQKANLNKKGFRAFLTKIEKKTPKVLDELVAIADNEVWKEIDCLSCANCCKTMSPTFNAKDIKRIATHFRVTPNAFKEKWLYFDKKDSDWMNKKQPCQFLDLNTNMCNIYEIRPDDCAGFPHLTKKRMVDYIHVHKQNVAYCPATYKMVEEMKILVTKDTRLQ